MDTQTTQLIKDLEKMNEKTGIFFSLYPEKQKTVLALFDTFAMNKNDPTVLVKGLRNKMDISEFLYILADKCSNTTEQKELFIKVLDAVEKEYSFSLKENLDLNSINMIIAKQNKEAVEKVIPKRFVGVRTNNVRNPFLVALNSGDTEIVELVTSRMKTEQEVSSYNYYTYNYGTEYETISGFENLAYKGDTNMMAFMIEKGFDLKTKQVLEMLYGQSFINRGETNLKSFPLESAKFIISQLDSNNKNIDNFNEKDISSWALINKVRLMSEISKKTGTSYFAMYK